MYSDIQHNLRRLYQEWCGRPVEQMRPVSADGSLRKYFRIMGSQPPVIGAFNPDRKENIAFLKLSDHFREYGLPVPEIYVADLDHNIYLEQDLGEATLFSWGTAIRQAKGFSKPLIRAYEQALEILARFQIVAGRDLDYGVCYPHSFFGQQSIRWDLNYFKYHFLKLAQIPFDEQALENDFGRFIEFLMQADCNYFLYRDFQSRNIMLVQDQLYFIDYQGGRKGALQYDVASLLLDAKADLSWPLREQLLDYYLKKASCLTSLREEMFLHYYQAYALVRLMQAFGAYGYRGLYEGKAHFVRSIPYALNSLEGLLSRGQLPIKIPALTEVWKRLIQSESLQQLRQKSASGLTVHIQSFSYKKGQPRDRGGHGGGFVFDCRILPNPGRFTAYAHLTGQDPEVIRFLEHDLEVQQFLRQTAELVEQAVTHHRRRDFTDLTVLFGCTGGQHRSVFCAERLAALLKSQRGFRVNLQHRELEGMA